MNTFWYQIDLRSCKVGWARIHLNFEVLHLQIWHVSFLIFLSIINYWGNNSQFFVFRVTVSWSRLTMNVLSGGRWSRSSRRNVSDLLIQKPAEGETMSFTHLLSSLEVWKLPPWLPWSCRCWPTPASNCRLYTTSPSASIKKVPTLVTHTWRIQWKCHSRIRRRLRLYVEMCGRTSWIMINKCDWDEDKSSLRFKPHVL